MNPRPFGTCSLMAVLSLLSGCASFSAVTHWNNAKQADSARIVVSRLSPGDCIVTVSEVDGQYAGFAASLQDARPPVLMNDVDWPLYLPPGTHQFALGVAWGTGRSSARYTPMNTTTNAYYDHTWTNGVSSQGKVTALFKGGHTYRLYAVHKSDFEVTLSDITVDPDHPVGVQTWIVPGPAVSARVQASGSIPVASN